jgi:hypothetical protein
VAGPVRRRQSVTVADVLKADRAVVLITPEPGRARGAGCA